MTPAGEKKALPSGMLSELCLLDHATWTPLGHLHTLVQETVPHKPYEREVVKSGQR